MITVIERQYMEPEVSRNLLPYGGETDWEQRRYEIARDAMSAILGNPGIVSDVTEEGEPVWGVPVAIARTAVTLADLLVEELKQGKETKK